MSKLERLSPINFRGYCCLSAYVKQISFAYFDAVGLKLFDKQKKLYGAAVDLKFDLDSVVFGLGSIADINSDDHELFFKKLMRYYKLDFSPNVFSYSTRFHYTLDFESLLTKCAIYLENYYTDAASYQEYMWLEVELNTSLNSYRLNDSESNRIRAFYKFACHIISSAFILQKLHAYWLERDNNGDERLNEYLVRHSVPSKFYYIPAIVDLNPTWRQIDLVNCF